MTSRSLALIFLFFLAWSKSLSQANEEDEGRISIIFVSPPLSNDTYYAEMTPQLMDWYARFIKVVNSPTHSPNEYVFAVVNEWAANELINRGISADSGNLFINSREMDNNAQLVDVWMRDWGTVQIDDTLYKFVYRPDYLNAAIAANIDHAYRNWLKQNNVTYTDLPEIILDGGNFVLDPIHNRVIISSRILLDNPQFSESELIAYLQSAMGFAANSIAIIPEAPVRPAHSTGHADGMVTWLNAQQGIIGVNDWNTPTNQFMWVNITRALNGAFGAENIQIVRVPYDPQSGKWEGFWSAAGVYTNVLDTHYSFYTPTYDLPMDGASVALDNQYKPIGIQVKPVNSSVISIMGGAVRCLTGYMRGKPAQLFLEQHNLL